MIHRFTAKNYLSFHQPLELDFRLTPAAAADYGYAALTSPSGAHLSAAMVVLGRNASGKSNALKALLSLAQFAAHSFHYLANRNSTGLDAHCLHGGEASEFEIEFDADDGQHYRYTLHTTSRQVIYEELKVKGARQFRRVYTRAQQDDDLAIVGVKLANPIRREIALLSLGAQLNIAELMPAWRFLNAIRGNLDVFGRYPLFFSMDNASARFRTDSALLQQALQQLRQWDVELGGIEFDEREWRHEDGTQTKYFAPVAVHHFGDRIIRRELALESSGTQTLFALLGVILPALATGDVAVIDELESDLHPHMLSAVLELFLRPESNPHGAQLLFTTHAAEIINHLHKPQIMLVEKRDGYSEAWSLKDVRGVAERDNFAAKYLAGAYGAVPEM